LFEADCYQSFTLSNQSIADYQTKVLNDVMLVPVAGSAPSNLTASNIGSSSATISWDAIIGATYDYQYRLVGSPTWTTVSTSNATVNLSGLNNSSQYEVQVRSTCNSNTSSYSGSTLFTTTTPPPCSGMLISSFPYSESFENTIGDWIQDTSDNFNWTINSSTTSSPNTGPSIANSGNFYLYTEASGRTAGDQAILNSPCFNLNNTSSATFSFSYHMYGNQMGTLTLQYSIDDGNNWNNLWTLSGDQGNSWVNINNINLSPYINNYLRLRFIGVRGSGNRSDMAIDNIGLTVINAATTWYQDSDNDNFGNPSVSQVALSQPAGYVSDNTDCNDTDSAINPNTVWYLGVDSDGDGFFGSQV
ncbi:fibronectin type III domain-containing protein, partial [Litoribaculum gwangyangense]|uniref:fibronectin type III domain-containing protein n=1 Tax=Litoribaculum gwangyangense TaxID=1130722 RepID=UPI0031F0ACF8